MPIWLNFSVIILLVLSNVIYAKYRDKKADDFIKQIDRQLADLQNLDKVVCHTNLKENAELIAKILDSDSENKIYKFKEEDTI